MQKDISFGEWVRQRRHIMDLTQQELADQVGCARITLRRIESGSLKPSKTLAQILLEKLGTPLTERERWLQFARGLSGFPEKADTFSSKPKTNLPTALTSFIGREMELDEVANLIAKNRLVTLAGVGGIGKTRLAIEVGQRLLNAYPHGVWFVALDSLSDPALVPQAAASVFDIREDSSDTALIDRLIFSLRAKTMLLILDNCEHLLETCAQLIKTLLTSCPNLKFLTTSRETLGVEGGVTYITPSLSLPKRQNIEPISELTRYESIMLFCERAVLSMPSFILTDDKAAAVINISGLLDGIPLAIELAAAHVDILQVHEILKQLKHCLDLLTSNNRTVPPKHQTIRASLDWSWGLLSEEEQTFMRQLSVFAGSWTLGAAKAVCGGSTLNLMSTLVKKSLIVVNQESDRETRYHFHEVVRQYTREKLVQAGEEGNIRTQHLKYFLQFSEQAEFALRGPTQIEWYARLNNERDNIRATLDWADQTDVEAGLYISGRLHRFWENFDLREGQRWLNVFLEKSESKNYPRARANALYTQTWIMHWVQQPALALRAAQECLDLYQACSDQSGEIDGLLAMVLLAPIAGNMDGTELYHRALALSKSLGDPWRQAQVLFQSRFLTLDDYHHNSYLAKSAALFRKTGDLEFAIQPMLWLANEGMVNGNLQSAQQWLDQAKQIGHGINHKGLRSMLLLYSGSMGLLSGTYDKARVDLQKAIQLFEDLGNRLALLWVRVRLGYVALRQGEISDAYHLFNDTALDFHESKSPSGLIYTLEGMAGLCVVSCKPERAARLIGWTDAARKELNDRRPLLEQADVDKILAACLAKMGEVAFSDAYDEGQKMTLDEAVAYALNES